ncbi:MAG: DUF364 domain-containing protein [Firmicutes bacterium]|nr:DUF364 domain-containing protein [Bacillota bacterium]
MWKLYDSLIGAIPKELKVADFLCGNSWTMIQTETGGIGLATTVKEATRKPMLGNHIKGMPLREVAEAAKSWNLLEASIGVAAINAYYNAASRTIKLGIAHNHWQQADSEAFTVFKEEVKGKKVASVGHFPPVVQALGASSDLSILERNPQPGDYPEAACEYLLPAQDYVFITGETLIYKTLPRLLTLAANARVILVGPVAPLSEVLFKFGVDVICGFVVHDPHLCATIVKRGILSSIFAAGERVSFPKS